MLSSFGIFLTAVMGGLAVAVQAQMAGLLDQAMGTKESVFITYGIGGVLIALIILAMRGGHFSGWHNAPWYAYLSGLMGLVIVGSLSFCIPRMGIVEAFTVIVASQFIFGAVIDHFGFMGAAVRPIDHNKLIGMAVLVVGAWMILKK